MPFLVQGHEVMFFIKSLVCLREVFRFELFPDFFGNDPVD